MHNDSEISSLINCPQGFKCTFNEIESLSLKRGEIPSVLKKLSSEDIYSTEINIFYALLHITQL